MTPREALVQAFGEKAVEGIEDWKAVEEACLDPGTGDYLRENLVGYRSVIKGTAYSLSDYIRATRFCTLVNSGCTDTAAFEAVFPDRVKKLTRKGMSAGNLASGIRSYKRSALVQKILEQIRIPLYLLMSDHRVAALERLHTIMEDDDVHARDRVAAATALATQLAPPKESVHRVEIKDTSAENAIDALRNSLMTFSQTQREAIEAGHHTPLQIGKTKIIDVEVEDEE